MSSSTTTRTTRSSASSFWTFPNVPQRSNSLLINSVVPRLPSVARSALSRARARRLVPPTPAHAHSVQGRTAVGAPKDPHRVLRDLRLITGKRLTAGSSLLFIDEIQQHPAAITALRYLYEETPALHVIAAGSLLEFALEQVGIPVGRVTSLHMYPLSFLEFLVARDGPALARYLLGVSVEAAPGPAPSDAVHQRLLRLAGEYLVVGGLPEVPASWRRRSTCCAKPPCTGLRTPPATGPRLPRSRFRDASRHCYSMLAWRNDSWVPTCGPGSSTPRRRFATPARSPKRSSGKSCWPTAHLGLHFPVH